MERVKVPSAGAAVMGGLLRSAGWAVLFSILMVTLSLSWASPASAQVSGGGGKNGAVPIGPTPGHRGAPPDCVIKGPGNGPGRIEPLSASQASGSVEMAPGPCHPGGPGDKIVRAPGKGKVTPRERIAFVRFNRCIKERGVTIQPYPGPGAQEIHVEGPGQVNPKFREAHRACRHHLAPIGGVYPVM